MSHNPANNPANERKQVTLYHSTTPEAAESILKEGYRDRTGTYGAGQFFTGVWFADRPLSPNEGTKGMTVLSITIDQGLVAEYEWIEEGKPYREFLIPASLANSVRTRRVHERS